MDTSAQLFRQIGQLAEDETSLKKVLKYVNRLLSKKMASQTEECSQRTKEEILDDFRGSVKDLKLYQEGKLHMQSWEEFSKELDEEGYI